MSTLHDLENLIYQEEIQSPDDLADPCTLSSVSSVMLNDDHWDCVWEELLNDELELRALFREHMRNKSFPDQVMIGFGKEITARLSKKIREHFEHEVSRRQLPYFGSSEKLYGNPVYDLVAADRRGVA